MAGDTMVGPYRILRLINRGGQGSVYLGYDKRLQRRVAIKIYPLPEGRDARRNLLREAQLVASIHSPKVVQIHDVIESSDHLALVMEYVPGCDLNEFLASVRPSLASVLTIGADIAGALSAARQQHSVHGDLKAANVLIAANGRAKLTDFGIARCPASGKAVSGSLSALSPEQFLEKPVDERSDLFALGCLLYRMLGGIHPFMREGELDVKMLLEGAPQPLEELVPADAQLPGELVALVTALLQKNPQDRPTNPRVVRQVLRQVARTVPLAATNSLLAEAQACFRPESADDIPPAVPAGLGREGRSRLSGVGDSRVSLLGRQPAWRLAAGVAALVLVAGLGISLGLSPAETRIHIDAPVVRLAREVQLPRDVSGHWLVEEVTRAVSERLGPLRVTGPVGATPVTTLYADPTMRELQALPAEEMQLDLRCQQLLCVFAVSRTAQGQQANRQAVLFPDMSLEQWREIVRSTTLALYP